MPTWDFPPERTVADSTIVADLNRWRDIFQLLGGNGTSQPTRDMEEMNDTINGMPPRNYLINGTMQVWQVATSFTHAALVASSYTTDMFLSGIIGTGERTIARDTDVPAGEGFYYSQKLDVTVADAAIAATDLCAIYTKIEGYNFSPLVGKTATLSFWVKAVKTGIYCVSFRNAGTDRSYVAEYTINSANTWEYKTVTLTFDYTGGTWDYTNGVGLYILWTIAMGSDYQGVADTWNSANDMATSNQVNGIDHTDNNFWLTGVQLNEGSVALPYAHEDFGEVLAKCQRYYETGRGGMEAGVGANGVSNSRIPYKVQKRTATPVLTVTASLGLGAGNAISGNDIAAFLVGGATTGWYVDFTIDARL